jgi:uncharacterized protein (TIGR03000 family)
MMVNICSRRLRWLASTVLVVSLSGLLPSAVCAQSRFIHTPAEATAAEGDRIPPSWYGFPINDPAATTYFGGQHYREYYAYGRGYGIAGFPTSVPGACLIPDRRPLYTSYPETGEIYYRSGRSGGVPPTGPAPTTGNIKIDVPADATLWIEGVQSSQTGPNRSFTLPPLASGKSYLYRLRARWTDNGEPKEESRIVTVQPGAQVQVKFPMDAPPGKLPALIANESLSNKR